MHSDVGTEEQELHPVLRSFVDAPADDEPYTEAQRERDAEAEVAITGGEGISHEEVLREFGLQSVEGV
jgi:hypothetical protein